MTDSIGLKKPDAEMAFMNNEKGTMYVPIPAGSPVTEVLGYPIAYREPLYLEEPEAGSIIRAYVLAMMRKDDAQMLVASKRLVEFADRDGWLKHVIQQDKTSE